MSADLGETPNAQRLAKSNPCSVEGLLQRNRKFPAQYLIPPGFKNKLANFHKPMSTRQIYYRPPGAIFFLHRRRKNMERKTPRRAGCSPPYEPTPWVGVGGAGGLVSTSRQICDCIRALIAGVRAASRFAVAYALRL